MTNYLAWVQCMSLALGKHTKKLEANHLTLSKSCQKQLFRDTVRTYNNKIILNIPCMDMCLEHSSQEQLAHSVRAHG